MTMKTHVALAAAVASLCLLSACSTIRKPPPSYDNSGDWIPINGAAQYGMSCPQYQWARLCPTPTPPRNSAR
jgi:outer membrane protein assembly factor BamE (lipoprotein component of BamABCDE complex)